MIKTFPGYNKLIVPPPLGNDSKLNINISINLDKIITIDENGGHFKTKITMLRKWINPQLSYLNLKRNIEKNLISTEESERIWTPRMDFKNVDQADDIKVTDFSDMMVILPNSEFKFEKDDRSNMRNTRLFKGSENVIFYLIMPIVTETMCPLIVTWFLVGSPYLVRQYQ